MVDLVGRLRRPASRRRVSSTNSTCGPGVRRGCTRSPRPPAGSSPARRSRRAGSSRAATSTYSGRLPISIGHTVPGRDTAIRERRREPLDAGTELAPASSSRPGSAAPRLQDQPWAWRARWLTQCAASARRAVASSACGMRPQSSVSSVVVAGGHRRRVTVSSIGEPGHASQPTRFGSTTESSCSPGRAQASGAGFAQALAAAGALLVLAAAAPRAARGARRGTRHPRRGRPRRRFLARGLPARRRGCRDRTSGASTC